MAYGTELEAAGQPVVTQSGLGIASFIIAVAVGFGMALLVVYAGVVEASTPGGMNEQSTMAMLIGFGALGGMAAAVLGIVLGIGGLVQRDRKRLFAVLGLVLNGLTIVGVAGLILVGLLVQSAGG